MNNKTLRYITELEHALPNNAVKVSERDIDCYMLAVMIKRGYNTNDCHQLYDWYYIFNPNNPKGLEYDRIKSRRY